MDKKSLKYDKTDPLSIEEYAQKLIGKTFNDVIEDYYIEESMNSAAEPESVYKIANTIEKNSNKGKGNLGQIIEEHYFYYKPNIDSNPDFSEAGVELKVTPYKINKNGSKSAKERLVITMIDFMNVYKEEFDKSGLWNKAKLMLLIYYLYNQNLISKFDYRIDYAKLFSPPKEDIEVMKHDFDVIIQKIKDGKAHELSEGDTLYLGACPKASTSKDRRRQPFNYTPAKPRAFAFKNSYMTYVLNNYIIPGKNTYENIVSKEEAYNLEEYVTNRIRRYKGKTVDELCELFELDYVKKPKSIQSLIVYRILGIKGNQAEEFVKANVVVKTIRITKTNKIKENMSFPNFKFKEIIKEDWDDSEFGNYLRETRFLFVVFKENANGELVLMGSQFWNIPYDDLENEVRLVWEKTKSVIENELEIKVNDKGIRFTNLPKQSENRVSHVRPHARNAADTYELPDGRLFTKQCFWLNNTYIYEQLKDELKFDQN